MIINDLVSQVASFFPSPLAIGLTVAAVVAIGLLSSIYEPEKTTPPPEMGMIPLTALLEMQIAKERITSVAFQNFHVSQAAPAA